MDKSWQPCHDQGIVFLPLAVESLSENLKVMMNLTDVAKIWKDHNLTEVARF